MIGGRFGSSSTRILSGLLLWTSCAIAGTTYQYTTPEGTPLFTDQPPNTTTLQDHEFTGYHGRPPARASCAVESDLDTRGRVERIEPRMQRFAREFGVEPTLVRAIIAVESCFDPQAVSRVGAQGLMQLMPATAKQLGVSDSFNVEENLRGGIEYFSRLHARYEGDTVRALAAYNAGPSAVDRHGGIPPFEETRNYIERVLDHWQEFRDAALE